MKTPGRFKRGAATTAVFLLFGPFVAGLLVAGVSYLARVSFPAPGEVLRLTDIVLSGLLGGFVLHLGPALLTGLGMSFASPRIASAKGWLGWSTLCATVLSVGVCLLLFSASSADTALPSVIVALAALGLPGVLGGLAAAAASLRLRPRPSTEPTVEVFA